MSFRRALRSRLKSTGDVDQGSPCRSSVYTQLSALLADEPRLHDSVDSTTEEELLSFVSESQANKPDLYAELAAAMTAEQINPSPANASLLRQKFLSSKDSLDPGSDRDSEGPNEETVLRNAGISSSSDRLSRRRFSQRNKRRFERSKSLDRANAISLPETESTDSLPALSPDALDITGPLASKESRLPHRRIAAWARELIDDLQEIDVRDDKEEEPEGKPLSIKRLKNNIVRFGRATKPVSSASDSVRRLMQWESPTATVLFVFIASYALWHGLVLPLVIFVAIWKLTVNYLISQGWFGNSGVTSKDRPEEGSSCSEKSSSVTDRLSLILQVARKVQNQLGSVCDAAEKVKNLLMWRHEATRKLYLALWMILPVTLLIPASLLITSVAFYFLVKVFIVDYMFLRFPRLRAKYDTSSKIWQTLPTDADLDNRQRAEQGLSNTALGQSGDSRTFSELFNLPPNEVPLPGWQNGLRSTLVNRDKSLTSSLKTGRLFLTNNYLCFERSKTHAQKNIVIPLDRITRLEKGNQYSWIPGGGMIIEVFVQGIDKAYTFGAIMNRDDTFSAIRIAAEKKGCVWEEDNPKKSEVHVSP